MVYKNKDGRFYIAKFYWKGKLIRRSTRAMDKKTARSIEAQIRAELAKGNWGILERKPSPLLREFLSTEFMPFTRSTFKTKQKTLEYYEYGVERLLKADLAKLKIEEITDQHAGHFASRNDHLSPSTINCGLRTLRRALSLAVEWGKLDRMPRIRLAKGERQRERVLTESERGLYLQCCPQPWRDIAVIMLGTGMRPVEVFTLRWEHLLWRDASGIICIMDGKSKAARRALPMVPAVFGVLRARLNNQNQPSEGWVFPSASKSGHVERDSVKKQHAKALTDSKVKAFEPYCLRHTALTDLAALGCDSFTLAKIAGHSSITITQRYCHPQADAIERAFANVANRQEVVTDAGHLIPEDNQAA
jgi:integrase